MPEESIVATRDCISLVTHCLQKWPNGMPRWKHTNCGIQCLCVHSLRGFDMGRNVTSFVSKIGVCSACGIMSLGGWGGAMHVHCSVPCILWAHEERHRDNNRNQCPLRFLGPGPMAGEGGIGPGTRHQKVVAHCTGE